VPYTTVRTDPVHGSTVRLTIDRYVQDIVDTSLDEWMGRTSAERGWVVVQNPKTGEILAMSSRPNYDPHRYGAASDEARRNRAVSDNYEPGSIFKPITLAAAIDAGIIGVHSLVDVRDVPFAGRRIRESRSITQNFITLTEAMRFSSNRAPIRCAQELGRARFGAYLRAFGFGERTGSGIIGESNGVTTFNDGTTSLDRWSEADLVSRSFGQAISVTALQMATAFSAIANGGALMRPFIVADIKTANGETVFSAKPVERRRPISERTAREVTGMMRTVTDGNGTGRRARIPGYSVAGKTGTAQIPGVGGFNDEDFTASFAGFFPASDPQVVIVIGLYKARSKEVNGVRVLYHQGGHSAAPLFSEIGSKIAVHLRIPPDLPHEIE